MRALLAFALLSLSWVSVAQVPASCQQYAREIKRSAWRVFGPSAPVAALAAQVEVESACRKDAVSRVGAAGLAQFMPATAADMAKRWPDDCYPANPFNPSWAFRCRDRYMSSLIAAVKPIQRPSLDACDRWAFAFRAYNGGLGWVNRDRRMALLSGADPDSFAVVSFFNAGRSAANFEENIEYVPRILTRQAKYEKAGWGGGICHD